MVLALWKMAVLLEGHWARHVRGTASAGGFDFGYLEAAGPAFWARIRRELDDHRGLPTGDNGGERG